MKIKSKVLSMANGDEYSNVDFELADDYLQLFMPIRTEGQDVWINPELIASFDVAKTDKPATYRKILEGAKVESTTDNKVSK